MRNAVLVLLIGLMASLVCATPYISELAEPGRADREKGLVEHGVNVTPEAMIKFIREGFDDATIERGLPKQPPIKAEILVYAIQELGFQESIEAVPVLTSIVKGEETAGIRSVLQLDVEPYSISQEEARKAEMSGILQYNCVVALGLIGDPLGIEAVRQYMKAETRPVPIAETAIALSLMGDPEGMGMLVNRPWNSAGDADVAYFAGVYVIAGRNYGITTNSSIARRRKQLTEFQSWWKQNGASFVPERRDILRRRLAGVQPEALPFDSLRGSLRTSRNFEDYDQRYAAYTRLQGIAVGAVPELKSIALDPMEDIDIRVAAMDWYAASVPKEAKKVMKSLKDDENEAIRLRAIFLLEDIAKAEAKD